MVYIEPQDETEESAEEVNSTIHDSTSSAIDQPIIRRTRSKKFILIRWLLIGVISGAAAFIIILSITWSRIAAMLNI